MNSNTSIQWKTIFSFLIVLSSYYFGNAQVAETRLNPTTPNPQAADFFGDEAAINGEFAAIGATQNDNNGLTDNGAVFVFNNNGTGWSQTTILTASDADNNDLFGAVDLDGDYMVVGASGDDDNGSNSGSAYIFKYDGSGWVQEAKLTASDGAAGDQFGGQVHISGDRAFVSATQNMSSNGAVYVFKRTGTTWTEEDKITATDGVANAAFGSSVSALGFDVIIGASGDDDNGTGSGSAYIFRFNGASWNQVAKLTASDGASGDELGQSVALISDYAIVGAPGDDDNGANSGSAYVFTKTGFFGWVDATESVKITASDAGAGHSFGSDIRLSEDLAVVSAEGNDAVYAFRRYGSDWLEVSKIEASDGSAGDGFGSALDLDGDQIAVGASANSDNGANSGAAYVYSVSCLVPDFTASLDFEDGQLPNTKGWEEFANNNASHSILTGGATTGFFVMQSIGSSPNAGWYFNTEGLVDINDNWIFEADVRCIQGCGSGCNDVFLSRYEDCNGGFVSEGPGCTNGAGVQDGFWHHFTMEMDHATGLITSTIDGLPTGNGLTNPAQSLSTFSESPARVGIDERHISFSWKDSPGSNRVLLWDNVLFRSFDQCNPTFEVDAGPDQTIGGGCAPSGGCVTLTTTLSNGTPPFTYEWSTGETTASITVCPTASTTYSVSVSDANTDADGCLQAIDEVNVTVESIDPLVATASSSGIVCGTNCIGTATASATGGDGDYDYLWDDPMGQTTATATGLCAGTYTVTVSDQSGCFDIASTTLLESSDIVIDICPDQNVAYFGDTIAECECDGKIITMSVVYDGPAGATVSVGPDDHGNNTTSFANVQPGDTLSANLGDIGNNWYWDVNGVQDADIHASCSDDILLNVNSSKSDFGHLGNYPNPDQNSNDGTFLVIGHLDDEGNGCGVLNQEELCALVQVSISIDGGTAPYTYAWSNGSTDSTMQDFICESTDYTVTVTDAFGCSNVSSVHSATVVNIGCDEDKVTMCHHPGTPDAHTHCIKTDDVQKKLDEGYALGDCNTSFDPGVCGPAPPVVCECEGGIQKFGFTYLGASGADISFFNDNHPDPQDLIATFTNVSSNELLVIKSWSIGEDKFKSDMSFTIDGVQGPEIHTSCSQPLQDAFFGDLYVTGYVDKEGNGCFLDPPCVCEDGVQTLSFAYIGASGVDIALYNDHDNKPEDFIIEFTDVQEGDTIMITSDLIGAAVFNDKISFSIDGVEGEEIEVSCSKRLEDRKFQDLCVVGFVDYQGNGCNLPSLPPPPLPCDCDGKIVEMSVEYGGPSGATITVGDDEYGNNPTTFTNVQTGDTLTATLGDIGNNWYWSVNGAVDADIHTSCSDEILGNINSSKSDFGHLGTYPNPDQNSNDGTFLVVGHKDDNGNGCGYQPPTPKWWLQESMLKPGKVNIKAYPNPFTSNVAIQFVSPASEHIELVVYDLTGQKVETLFSESVDRGIPYEVQFNSELRSDGIYFYRLITASGKVYTGKLIQTK